MKRPAKPSPTSLGSGGLTRRSVAASALAVASVSSPALSSAAVGALDEARYQSAHALTIGMSTYARARSLRHGSADALSVADALAARGFRLHDGAAKTDLTRKVLVDAVRAFAADVPENGLAFVWISGHGIAHQGQTFLLPSDDQHVRSRADLATQAVPLSMIVGWLVARQNSHAVLFIDTCRANPLPLDSPDGTRANPAISDLVAPGSGSNGSVTLIYSAAPGQIASDGSPEAGNSPFALAVLRAIAAGDLSSPKMFAQLTKQVRSASDGYQTPWMVQAGLAPSLLAEF
ncbi:MAG: caspase family protein [Pseudomonadota bacterium]